MRNSALQRLRTGRLLFKNPPAFRAESIERARNKNPSPEINIRLKPFADKALSRSTEIMDR
jgi:hypothetical protein